MKKKDIQDDQDIETVQDDIEFEEDIIEEQGVKESIKKLRQKLRDTEAESKSNLDGWQRSRADYINLQKTYDAERGDIRKRAQADIINDLLPVLDNFDAAMKNTEVWEKVDENWRRGIEYIAQQFHKILEDYGVVVIKENIPFDPRLHEPLETIITDDESQDHKILKTLQKGYMIHDKVLRPAKVSVYHYQSQS